MKHSGFAHIFLLIILLIGLAVGVYLVQQKQIFKGRATFAGVTQPVNVLVLNYLPPDPNNLSQLDSSITLQPDSIEHMRSWITEQNSLAIETLTQAAKYHGFKNPAVTPAITYTILDTKEFLKATPRRFWTNIGETLYYADYQKMLTEDVNICDFVDNQGVKDVWIWGYQTNQGTEGVGIFESNMSMGKDSRQYWNKTGFGDISNDHHKLNDLPSCNKTYVVYNHNYRGYGGVDNIMHIYGHQIENEMKFADQSLWNQYTQRNNDPTVISSCGDVHGPPNTVLGSEYDYGNTRTVKSDCQDWKPGHTGKSEDVNCRSWTSDQACLNNPARGYYTWWMQNIPGLDNGVVYNGQMLRNWWDFMADFDKALQSGRTLHQLMTSSPTPTPPAVGYKITLLPDQGGEKTKTVAIEVNTNNDGANLFVTRVVFPKDKLEAVSIDKTGSIINNWVEEYIDNSIGEVSLVGGVPTPGTKTNGQFSTVAKIVFNVKGTGYAVVGFTRDTAIYRDQDNTNIFTGGESLTVNLGQEPIITPTVAVTAVPQLQGDLNKNSKLDLADLSVLLSQFNKTVSGVAADLNSDGIVNSLDFAKLRQLLFAAGIIKPLNIK